MGVAQPMGSRSKITGSHSYALRLVRTVLEGPSSESPELGKEVGEAVKGAETFEDERDESLNGMAD